MGTFLGAYRDLEVKQVHLPQAVAFWDGGSWSKYSAEGAFVYLQNP